MPAGFCSPFTCHNGIIANRTMHQAKAIATQNFSDRWAGFHQMPGGDCIAVFMRGLQSWQWRLGERHDLPQSPSGIEDEHHDDAREQQQERTVIESLSEGDFLVRRFRSAGGWHHKGSL